VLAAAANDDPVAPVDSVRPLLDVIGSDDKEWLQAHGSHLSLIAGAEARHRVWPTIVRWLAARD
jgi:polyhydroxyalkanoate synthase